MFRYRWLRHFVQDVVVEYSGKRGIVVGRGVQAAILSDSSSGQ